MSDLINIQTGSDLDDNQSNQDGSNENSPLEIVKTSIESKSDEFTESENEDDSEELIELANDSDSTHSVNTPLIVSDSENNSALTDTFKTCSESFSELDTESKEMFSLTTDSEEDDKNRTKLKKHLYDITFGLRAALFLRR